MRKANAGRSATKYGATTARQVVLLERLAGIAQASRGICRTIVYGYVYRDVRAAIERHRLSSGAVAEDVEFGQAPDLIDIHRRGALTHSVGPSVHRKRHGIHAPEVAEPVSLTPAMPETGTRGTRTDSLLITQALPS